MRHVVSDSLTIETLGASPIRVSDEERGDERLHGYGMASFHGLVGGDAG